MVALRFSSWLRCSIMYGIMVFIICTTCFIILLPYLTLTDAALGYSGFKRIRTSKLRGSQLACYVSKLSMSALNLSVVNATTSSILTSCLVEEGTPCYGNFWLYVTVPFFAALIGWGTMWSRYF